jgi:hypothetical protein
MTRRAVQTGPALRPGFVDLINRTRGDDSRCSKKKLPTTVGGTTTTLLLGRLKLLEDL